MISIKRKTVLLKHCEICRQTSSQQICIEQENFQLHFTFIKILIRLFTLTSTLIDVYHTLISENSSKTSK